jgi:hypothetical protein
MDCFPRARPLVSHHVKKMSFYETLDVRYLVHKGPTRDWDSVVGIMSHYGLGIDFPHPSGSVLVPQPIVL